MLLALACTLSPHRRCARHLSKLGSFFFFLSCVIWFQVS